MDYGKIKVVCIDVDGVLTDGIYQIFGHSRIIKSFYTRDFYGIQQLLENGLQVNIISQSHDKVIQQQVDRICSHSEIWKKHFIACNINVFTGSNNKKETIEKYIMKSGIEWGNIAYIGDAENDLECMKLAKYTACPADAVEQVIWNSNYVSAYKGGKGVVYDVCMYLLKNIKKEEENNANIGT